VASQIFQPPLDKDESEVQLIEVVDVTATPFAERKAPPQLPLYRLEPIVR
jgi:hypothetical protein